eukprot:364537-Chlamydomonas_euryale.AAC.7
MRARWAHARHAVCGGHLEGRGRGAERAEKSMEGCDGGEGGERDGGRNRRPWRFRGEGALQLMGGRMIHPFRRRVRKRRGWASVALERGGKSRGRGVLLSCCAVHVLVETALPSHSALGTVQFAPDRWLVQLLPPAERRWQVPPGNVLQRYLEACEEQGVTAVRSVAALVSSAPALPPHGGGAATLCATEVIDEHGASAKRSPCHATPGHATPGHATPGHATPGHATSSQRDGRLPCRLA